MAKSLSLPFAKFASISICAISLTACATVGKSSSSDVSKEDYYASIGAYANPKSDQGMDPIAAAAFWGTRYNRDQADPKVAVKFSNALRKIGSVQESIGVMQKAEAQFPDNLDVSVEYLSLIHI